MKYIFWKLIKPLRLDYSEGDFNSLLISVVNGVVNEQIETFLVSSLSDWWFVSLVIRMVIDWIICIITFLDLWNICEDNIYVCMYVCSRLSD